MDDLDLGATIKGFNAGQKIFGRYTLKRILGRGGMGVVWLARDEELERDVALKFLPEVVAMDKEAVRDLKRETRRSLELTHSHIVRIYDFIQDVRTAAISMEYIAGETIAARKVDHPAGHFEAAELEAWVRQLLEALAYAHTKGEVVHRDLKPANLMIDARGDLKIADFGIAASVSDSVSRVSAQAGSSGTPVYMSPQQMMGEKPAVTDDIYAFGATVYELLTGKPPFHSGNVMMQVQNKMPPAMAARRQELETTGVPIPAAWEETIAACLAKDPQGRPQGAREVARRLGLTGSVTAAPFAVPPVAAKPAPAPPVERDVPTSSQPVQRPGSTSKIPLYAGLASAVLVLAGVGYYLGVHAPEQKRMAEIQRLQEQGRAAEAALLRNEKEKNDAVAKDKADAEQQAYAIMVAKIDALLDGTTANQREATEQAVKEYRATVPARFKVDIESRWTKRVAGWEAHRLNLARGGFRVRTNPEGAEVQIGSLALEKSPVVKNDVRLGKYPLTVRADGFEEFRGEIEVKENDFTDPGLIKLVRSTGQLDLRSDPAGAEFVLQQRGREEVRRTGKLPQSLADLPTGTYTLTARVPGLTEVTEDIAVARNSSVPIDLKFAYGAVQVTSEPAGADVWSGTARLGRTPLTLNNRATGEVALEIRTKGYARQKVAGRLEAGRTLALAATLKKGGYEDPVSLAEAALEEIEKETEPMARTQLFLMLGYHLSQLDGVPADTLRAIGDRQLEAARRISDPGQQLAALASSIELAAGLDLDYSRKWAEAMVPVVRRITAKADRQTAVTYAGMFWMHPELAGQAATAMNDWFAGNDDEWIWVSMVAGLHKRFGNEAEASALAARAQGSYREDSIKTNLKSGEDDRRTDPISLSILRKDFAGAQRQMAGLSTLSYSTVARLAGAYLQKGDFESARQLGRLVDKTMAPYFPGLLVAFAITHHNPGFAEKMAATFKDTADTSPRSDAYRDLAAYYAKLGWKDKARLAAAQVTSYGNLEYGLGRQQAVPVLMAAGEEDRARRLAQSVPVSYAKDKAYLAGYNAAMFLSIGDNDSYNRSIRLYEENTPAVTVGMVYGFQLIPILCNQGRLDEAEQMLSKAANTAWWSNGALLIGLAKARATKEDDYDALLENTRPGRARGMIYNGILALKVEKKMLARNAQ